jgi:hypothetical protein
MDGRMAIHVADRPLLPVSTDFLTLDTLVDRLRSVATKSQPELTQSVAGRPASPWDPLTYSLAPRGLCVINISVVTLSLVEFQMFL